jgi:hypothetical protein
MITADVSDYISKEFATAGGARVREAYASLAESYRRRIEERYLPLEVPLDTGETISFSRGILERTALIYGVGRLTGGCFHLKTAGTNWLEAVKIMAVEETAPYRRLHQAALERFQKATGYYHVTTNLDNVPQLTGLADADLRGLFDNPDSRQLIHITYGELLKDPEIGGLFFIALHGHIEEYWQALESHIGRHLENLGVGTGG